MDDTNKLIEQRLENLAALREAGNEPFANKFTPSENCGDAKTKYTEGRSVAVAGRLISKREMGKTIFAHIRDVSGKPCGFKTVIGSSDAWEELFKLIVARGPESAPDFICIDGGEGGTGAAPMPLIDLVGMPIREALPRIVDLRDRYGLKDRIRIIASGKLVNPADVAWAICLGADFVASARGFMFSLGCIQALKCNRNTCPTGITTHDPRLQKGLVVEDKYMKVANYAKGIIKEVETIAHSVGVSEPRQMRRRHVRIVQADGSSIPFNKIRPSYSADTAT
ncbi:MAG: glutamate synthase-related protein [Martelella sp.]